MLTTSLAPLVELVVQKQSGSGSIDEPQFSQTLIKRNGKSFTSVTAAAFGGPGVVIAQYLHRTPHPSLLTTMISDGLARNFR